jgi:hypothetical protein
MGGENAECGRAGEGGDAEGDCYSSTANAYFPLLPIFVTVHSFTLFESF